VAIRCQSVQVRGGGHGNQGQGVQVRGGGVVVGYKSEEEVVAIEVVAIEVVGYKPGEEAVAIRDVLLPEAELDIVLHLLGMKPISCPMLRIILGLIWKGNIYWTMEWGIHFMTIYVYSWTMTLFNLFVMKPTGTHNNTLRALLRMKELSSRRNGMPLPLMKLNCSFP
jgi:hypothetical protein